MRGPAAGAAESSEHPGVAFPAGAGCADRGTFPSFVRPLRIAASLAAAPPRTAYRRGCCPRSAWRDAVRSPPAGELRPAEWGSKRGDAGRIVLTFARAPLGFQQKNDTIPMGKQQDKVLPVD